MFWERFVQSNLIMDHYANFRVSAFRQPEEPSFWEEFFLPFLLTMLISFLVYCIPVLIYRFGIRNGAPLETKWKATWVGWIFWNCSYTALLFYYLIAGYYDDEDFSVSIGICDILCMGINWLLLYLPFNKKAQTKPKCTKCGAPLSPNAKFCLECGTKVPPPVPDGMIVCPGCLNTVAHGKYCPECGHKFVTDQTASAPKQYVRTYPPPRTTQLEQKMKSQYTDEEMKKIILLEKEKDSGLKQEILIIIVLLSLLLSIIVIGYGIFSR